MNSLAPLPNLSPEQGLRRYLQQIREFPVLSAEEELTLAKRWRDEGDVSAAHRLVTSHLRLVAKIALGYRGYGLPMGEMIAEGNIGLMQAVKKFDPDKGFRLTTYAIWWIKAAMQEYILRMWSLVKIGSSGAQKRLFFNLRKLKRQMQVMEEGDLSAADVAEIAQKLDVEEQDVVDMNRRMIAQDASLNQTVGAEGDTEWMDMVASPDENQETILIQKREKKRLRDMLKNAMAKLNPRERDIIQRRQLQDKPSTLDDLSQVYNVSRERVRQIETRAMEKLQKEMRGLRED